MHIFFSVFFFAHDHLAAAFSFVDGLLKCTQSPITAIAKGVDVLVADGDNVGLHSVIGGVCRGARHHDALVEVTECAVGIVATRCQDDGTLLVHWLVAGRVRSILVSIASLCNLAIWAWPIVHGLECAGRRVSTLEGKAVGAPTQVERDKRVRQGLVVGVDFGLAAATCGSRGGSGSW